MNPLSQRCLYHISTRIPHRLGPLESFFIKLAMSKLLREFDDSVYWYVPLIFMSDVVSEPHLMSCNSQISWYIGPKRLFQAGPDSPFPLCAYFQEPSIERMAAAFPEEQIFLSDAFVPQKKRKWKLLSSPRILTESRANWSFVDFFCSACFHINMNKWFLNIRGLG